MTKKATWIWYFGDFEIYHHLKLSMQRSDYGHFIPAFWKVSDCNRCVRFKKIVNIASSERVFFTIDGIYSIAIDGEIQNSVSPLISSGEHEIIVNVYNSTGIPAIFVKGKTIVSDSSWFADATMTFYGSHYKPVGCWNLNNKEITPTEFSLPEKHIEPKLIYKKGIESIYDFGKEVNIRLVLHDCEIMGKYKIYYGESLEEVRDNKCCVLRDEIHIDSERVTTAQRGCRYVRILGNPNVKIYGLNQYLSKQEIGKFKSDDKLFNKIYDVSKYTYDLTAGLFFVDGIKRDKWVWSGDSFVASLCDFYYCFDKEIIKRNIIALRGRDPILSHINGIVDFSFYLIISVGIYYLYTADDEFVVNVYDSMKTLLDFCTHNISENGFFVGDDNVWTFVDWADMNKNGAVCAIQMLYCTALKTMSELADIACSVDADMYKAKYEELKDKINNLYWNEEFGAYVTSFINGHQINEVRRHANILAIIFDIADENKKMKILNNVLLNNEIPAITTPFFSFFENAALCRMECVKIVRDKIEQYWGAINTVIKPVRCLNTSLI